MGILSPVLSDVRKSGKTARVFFQDIGKISDYWSDLGRNNGGDDFTMALDGDIGFFVSDEIDNFPSIMFEIGGCEAISVHINHFNNND